jgi:hypothetical protein
MVRLIAGAFGIALVLSAAAAQDKKETPATTKWEREAEGVVIKYEFGKDTLKVDVSQADNGAVFTCKTATDKDGVVKATVTESTEKGNFPPTPKKGFEFSFKWKVDGDKATLSEFKWEGADEAVRGIVEGEYKKKK